MKIVALETVQSSEMANLIWVRLHTDEGFVGLGETFRNPEATVAYIHETCAPYLIGKDPLAIEAHSFALMNTVGNRFNGFPTRSVELRGNSAIDIALWDIFGQAVQQPLYQLLGGLCQERVRIYNTCASHGYNTRARVLHDHVVVRHDRSTSNGVGIDDLHSQIHRPEELAEELLAEGITAMKIWPFDSFAVGSNGQHISLEDLKTGVRPIEKIRKAVGDRMDVMIEYHGLWRLPAALQIASALQDLDVYWHEEPVPMHNFDDLDQYKARVGQRVCGSESLGTKTWFREAFRRGAIDVAHFDIGWIGGITEGKKIAALAETFDRPIAPHDCVGPVNLVASSHLLLSSPNALVQETVRAYTRGYYRKVVTALPRIEAGHLYPMTGPGLGTELSVDFLQLPTTKIRRNGAG